MAASQPGADAAEQALDATAADRFIDAVVAGRRVDPAVARRIATGPAGLARLTALLAAARAPGRRAEVAREGAAVAAFRAARRAGWPAPAWLRRLLTVKAGALGAALLAGGVALAASTGVLPMPSPLGGDPPGRAGTPTPTSAAPAGSSTVLSTATGAPAGPAIPSAVPAPPVWLPGLCVAYLAQVAAEPKGSAEPPVHDNPAFAPLVIAAGEGEAVTGFCESLVDASQPDEPPHPTPQSTPVHPTRPPDPPAGASSGQRGQADTE